MIITLDTSVVYTEISKNGPIHCLFHIIFNDFNFCCTFLLVLYYHAKLATFFLLSRPIMGLGPSSLSLRKKPLLPQPSFKPLFDLLENKSRALIDHGCSWKREGIFFFIDLPFFRMDIN